ncbi:hypothetical protein [Falsirhodobacter halotolerans]|uniref:hypothetical protein n=1 Tax=Falsirhodobacter halotolerans TaxID=1146892 RepID=UPI001FD37924|nr:hypothetical protein [Falsirhodobacter halotolerans]MCJ8139523.1 hypothetical protein [Falsirhodobacter halotolerans]
MIQYLIVDPASGAILGSGAAHTWEDATASTGSLGICVDLASLPFEPAPDRHRVVEGQIVDAPPPDPGPALAAAQSVGRASVARAAEAARTALMPMRDLLRERDAVSWLAAADPDLADYPLIAAEIGVTASTGSQVAQVILHDLAARAPRLARLEGLMQEADVAIAAADDPAAVPPIVAASAAAITQLTEDVP